MTDPAGRRWMTTPTLALAVELGTPVRVHEAYIWPQWRRLRPWAEAFREARAACQSDPSPEAQAVLAAVKAAHNKFFGWLASEQIGGELARPDWDELVIAQSGANLYRPPRSATVAVGVDALCVSRRGAGRAAVSAPRSGRADQADRDGCHRPPGAIAHARFSKPQTGASMEARQSKVK
jgi:hypothetical protein